MKRFLGISIETNIGFAVMFLSSVGLMIFINFAFIMLAMIVLLVYSFGVYYFKFIFPYRPFEIVLYGDLYYEGDVLKISSSGKRVVVKKIISYNKSGTRMLVKPLKAK